MSENNGHSTRQPQFSFGFGGAFGVATRREIIEIIAKARAELDPTDLRSGPVLDELREAFGKWAMIAEPPEVMQAAGVRFLAVRLNSNLPPFTFVHSRLAASMGMKDEIERRINAEAQPPTDSPSELS